MPWRVADPHRRAKLKAYAKRSFVAHIHGKDKIESDIGRPKNAREAQRMKSRLDTI